MYRTGGGAATTISPSAFPLLAPDGTTAAPSYSFSSTPGAGLWLGGVQFGSAGTTDAYLVRDAANVLAQRNSTTAQTFRIYATFTDASNYERMSLITNLSGIPTLTTENAGTGIARSLGLGVGGVMKWLVENTTGHFKANVDNTMDIGASGANRPRNLYLGSAIKQIGGITTSGVVGAPAIVATGRVTAQNAANASISTFTVGAADASFEVSANMNVTAAAVLVTTLTCTYTDESNTARTMILPVMQLSGSFIAAGAITGTGAWVTPTIHIRCKAATAITILTSTGTFTTVTYTAEGIIRQLA